jgi:hypothetical protein
MDQIIEMDDNSNFEIFRHITKKKVNFNSKHTVFIVSFKFSHLSHKANKFTSIVPMLLITGFPGFLKKYMLLIMTMVIGKECTNGNH